MSAAPAFRILGFPVHVRAGFLYFLVLIVFINGVEYGLWLAGFMATLTLLHELGHALAARATGAQAEIALDFFYGYASFTPTRPLSRLERAGISFAGPAVQIGVGVAGLAVMGINPTDIDQVNTSAATFALCPRRSGTPRYPAGPGSRTVLSETRTRRWPRRPGC